MTPYRCPICNGSGAVPESLYGRPGTTVGETNLAPCRSCQGSGIVWGPPPFALPLPQPPSPQVRPGPPLGWATGSIGVPGSDPPTVPV